MNISSLLAIALQYEEHEQKQEEEKYEQQQQQRGGVEGPAGSQLVGRKAAVLPPNLVRKNFLPTAATTTTSSRHLPSPADSLILGAAAASSPSHHLHHLDSEYDNLNYNGPVQQQQYYEQQHHHAYRTVESPMYPSAATTATAPKQELGGEAGEVAAGVGNFIAGEGRAATLEIQQLQNSNFIPNPQAASLLHSTSLLAQQHPLSPLSPQLFLPPPQPEHQRNYSTYPTYQHLPHQQGDSSSYLQPPTTLADAEAAAAALLFDFPLSSASSSSSSFKGAFFPSVPINPPKTKAKPKTPKVPKAPKIPKTPKASKASSALPEMDVKMEEDALGLEEGEGGIGEGEGGHPFDCPISDCKKTFTRQFNLTAHLRCHRKEKPFVCAEIGCTLAFARKHDLSRHIKSIHERQKNFGPCQFCGQSFTRSDALRRHEKVEEQRLKKGKGFSSVGGVIGKGNPNYIGTHLVSPISATSPSSSSSSNPLTTASSSSLLIALPLNPPLTPWDLQTSSPSEGGGRDDLRMVKEEEGYGVLLPPPTSISLPEPHPQPSTMIPFPPSSSFPSDAISSSSPPVPKQSNILLPPVLSSSGPNEDQNTIVVGGDVVVLREQEGKEELQTSLAPVAPVLLLLPSASPSSREDGSSH